MPGADPNALGRGRGLEPAVCRQLMLFGRPWCRWREPARTTRDTLEAAKRVGRERAKSIFVKREEMERWAASGVCDAMSPIRGMERTAAAEAERRRVRRRVAGRSERASMSAMETYQRPIIGGVVRRCALAIARPDQKVRGSRRRRSLSDTSTRRCRRRRCRVAATGRGKDRAPGHCEGVENECRGTASRREGGDTCRGSDSDKVTTPASEEQPPPRHKGEGREAQRRATCCRRASCASRSSSRLSTTARSARCALCFCSTTFARSAAPASVGGLETYGVGRSSVRSHAAAADSRPQAGAAALVAGAAVGYAIAGAGVVQVAAAAAREPAAGPGWRSRR